MISSRPFIFGTIVGVPLHVHPIAVVICPLVATPCAIRDPVAALGLMIVLFGSILAHETAHALAAKSLGLRVEAIHHFGTAGLCVFEDPGRCARRRCVVAAAGPAVNFLIALTLLPLALSFPDVSYHHHPISVIGGAFAMNAALCVGNLVPVFPLDGSQILYALLWRRWSERTAVLITAGIGLVLAGPVALAALIMTVAGFPCVLLVLWRMNWTLFRRAWRQRDPGPASDLRPPDPRRPDRPPSPVAEADRLMANILVEQRRRNARRREEGECGSEPSPLS